MQITKKSLNSAFADVSEDVSLESTGDSTDLSPISEVSDGSRHGESIEVRDFRSAVLEFRNKMKCFDFCFKNLVQNSCVFLFWDNFLLIL